MTTQKRGGRPGDTGGAPETHINGTPIIANPAPDGGSGCTVEAHIRAEKTLFAFAFKLGEQSGMVKGHRVGFDEGHVSGFSEGTRSSANWKAGDAHGWVNGYLERVGDEVSLRGEAA